MQLRFTDPRNSLRMTGDAPSPAKCLPALATVKSSVIWNSCLSKGSLAISKLVLGLRENNAGVGVTMFIESDEQTRRWCGAEFRLVHRVTFGSELKLELVCINTGTTPFHFEEAVHTYSGVADVGTVRLQGLDGTSFLDNTDSNKERTQLGAVTITSQTDNAFINTQNAVDLLDPEMHRRIRLQKANSSTTVVWNPWQDAASGLRELGEGEWRQFLCVEASNIMGAAVRKFSSTSISRLLSKVVSITPTARLLRFTMAGCASSRSRRKSGLDGSSIAGQCFGLT